MDNIFHIIIYQIRTSLFVELEPSFTSVPRSCIGRERRVFSELKFSMQIIQIYLKILKRMLQNLKEIE